jgi:hypothetical protein
MTKEEAENELVDSPQLLFEVEHVVHYIDASCKASTVSLGLE